MIKKILYKILRYFKDENNNQDIFTISIMHEPDNIDNKDDFPQPEGPTTDKNSLS